MGFEILIDFSLIVNAVLGVCETDRSRSEIPCQSLPAAWEAAYLPLAPHHPSAFRLHPQHPPHAPLHTHPLHTPPLHTPSTLPTRPATPLILQHVSSMSLHLSVGGANLKGPEMPSMATTMLPRTFQGYVPGVCCRKP